MITLTASGTTIELPADLVWSDEREWAPVEQQVDRSITGSLIVQAAARSGGRPITLASSGDRAWLSTALLDQCQAWAAVPGQVMVLALRGTSRNVIWRHHDAGGAISAQLVMPYDEVQSTDDWICTLRFMEL